MLVFECWGVGAIGSHNCQGPQKGLSGLIGLDSLLRSCMAEGKVGALLACCNPIAEKKSNKPMETEKKRPGILRNGPSSFPNPTMLNELPVTPATIKNKPIGRINNSMAAEKS